MKYGLKNPKPLPSQSLIKEWFSYDHETGDFVWIYHPKNKHVIGNKCKPHYKSKYISASINGVKYQVHRLIYKYMTGNEPNIMDHINGDPSDNRWCNLRSVTPAENNLNMKLAVNNKSGTVGVYYHAKQNRWLTSVTQGKRAYHLGSFKTKCEAIAARTAANKMLGFSDRHGEKAA
jgi:hypothetical protein